MPLSRGFNAQRWGTRFRLFPQSPNLAAFKEPITVWVDVPAGFVLPGPADDRFYTIDPVDKRCPYGEDYLPPYRGAVYPPVAPDAQGHFDYLAVGTRAFNTAHLYASVRCVLDVWEAYFRRRINWHFRRNYRRMELVSFVDWDNAQSGYGFIETGYHLTASGEETLLCLNFDVIAHELGHSILYAEVGIPAPIAQTDEYFAFHESAADLCALVSSLHFEPVLEHILATSRGNLYVLNELNRIGELSDIEQIRLASNFYKMSNFINGWKTEHYLGLPLTGAIFDVFVDVFQSLLIQRDLIGEQLAELSARIPDPAANVEQLQDLYDTAYQRNASGFKEALLDARDYLGRNLALTWTRLSPDFLYFTDVEQAMLQADQELSGGVYRGAIQANFHWRQIGQIEVGPKLYSHQEAAVSCRL